MTFRVTLQKAIVQEAIITVEALDRAEAEEAASQRADDGMAAWTTIYEVTEAVAEGEAETV